MIRKVGRKEMGSGMSPKLVELSRCKKLAGL